MDSDQGKLFIGGISWETTEDKLREYFGKYGEVTQVVIMRDKISGRPRGFGFVVFSDHTLVDLVLQDKHTIDGRVVEAKRAMSREEQNTSSRSGNPSSRQSFGGSGGSGQRTKKIFVGGLPPTLSEEAFRKYFETFGSVTDVVVMYDQTTQRPRGFGFISFDSEDAVDRVLYKTFHDLGGKLVEVKRAMPKDALGHGSGNGRPMGGGGGGGGYQGGYGSPNPGSGGYEGRMDGGRYMGPQSGGGFPHYGSSGYGYAYGSGSNGVSYGGYGMGGYGGPGGGYGNPNAPAGGYPGGPRSPWSGQPPSGYGSTGYGGSAGYGAGSGHSPSGSGGYGNPGYGYGGYGSGSEFISRGGGSAGGGGGDQHGPGSGYMGGGYGDVGGGHPSSWKSDPAQGGGYGPGQSGYSSYGGGPSRHSQQ